MKALGIGCLHFSFKGGLAKEITVQEYIDEVKISLERLSTISDVEVYFDNDVKNEKINLSENYQMNDGEPCHPHIPFFELSFNLYLPKRVQAEVINREQKYLNTDTENFRVVFKHDWHGPFTFVECVGAKEGSSPSTSIQIIREYLKKEFDLVSEILNLDFVGPSPFHVDLFLKPYEAQKPESSSSFALTHTKVPGYDKLLFEYSNSSFDSEDLAVDSLFSELSSEIAFFYALNVMRSSKMRNWDIIQNRLHELLELEDEKYKKNLKDRFVKKPKLLSSLYREIGLFKGQEIYDRNIYEQHYFSIYKSQKNNEYLKPFIDGVLENWKPDPVKETSEIVSYFDSKSSKSMELLVVFMAAILGGAIGATITVLFGP